MVIILETERFVAVRKNTEGNLIAFKSNTGAEYNYEMAKELCRSGKIANAETFIGKGHNIYIRGKVDGEEDNNLANLPTF